MAKVPFSKLELKKPDISINTITFNGIDIEVKQYLPVDEKLQLIANVILEASDENRFYNPLKIKVFEDLEIIFAYTNLSFTETQKKDLSKLYDIINSNGLVECVRQAIPTSELENLENLLYKSVESIYSQINSLYGMLQSIASENSEVVEDNIETIKENLQSSENLSFLRDVVTKLV